MTVYDNSNPASGSNPTYGDSITLTATVTAAYGTPTGSVEFYDGSTDLGPGSYNVYSSTPLGLGVYEGSQWTLTLGPWSPALGSHTITAVYSGDNNFAGGQSSTTLNNVGQQLFIPGVGVNNFGQISGGGVAIVSGTVNNLDGAAFTVTVHWGDAETGGQADTENFSFAAGDTTFNIPHTYQVDPKAGTVSLVTGYARAGQGGLAASEAYTISVTVTSADNRTLSAENAASVTVTDPGPTIVSNEPDSPDGFSGPGPIQFTATASEPWDPGASLTAEWIESFDTGPGPMIGPEIGDPTTGTGTLAASASIDSETLGVMQFGHGGVMVTDGNGAYAFLPVTSWLIPQPAAPAAPTATITETDTNGAGLVFEGDAANFKIAVQFAPGTPLGTSATIYYETVDGTAAGGTDYVSTDGPHSVTVYSPDGGGEADATFTVQTTGGIDGGGDKTFSVKLLTPSTTGSGLVAQSGTNASATATIVRPEVDISSPGASAGQFDVPDDGTSVEVDLHAAVTAGLAGDTSLVLDLPQGTGGLLFYDDSGNALVPDGDNVLGTFAMPDSGSFTAKIWVAEDFSSTDTTTPVIELVAYHGGTPAARATARPSIPAWATFPVRVVASYMSQQSTATDHHGIDLTGPAFAGMSNQGKANAVTNDVEGFLVANAKLPGDKGHVWWDSITWLCGAPSAGDFAGAAGMSNVAIAVKLVVRKSSDPSHPIDFRGSEIMIVPFYWVQINQTNQRKILLPNGVKVLWTPPDTFVHESWHINGATPGDVSFGELVQICDSQGYTLSNIPGTKATANSRVVGNNNGKDGLLPDLRALKAPSAALWTDGWCADAAKRLIQKYLTGTGALDSICDGGAWHKETVDTPIGECYTLNFLERKPGH